MTGEQNSEVPESCKEYIIVQDTGWTLEYIKSMDDNEKEFFYLMALVKLNYRNFDIVNMMYMSATGKSLI